MPGSKRVAPNPIPLFIVSFVKRCLTWFEQTIIPLAQSGEDLTVLTTSHGAYIIVRLVSMLSDGCY